MVELFDLTSPFVTVFEQKNIRGRARGKLQPG
jgi:hypothetical protein